MILWQSGTEKREESRLYPVTGKEAFFGKMNPFSPVGGRFYCEQAIELVGAYIEQEFGIEAEQMSSKVEKYTGPYEVKK